MSVLTDKLRDMTENLAVDLGPSDDDRQAMREAADLLDGENTENAMLREVFTETQVIFEDSRIDFVDVRVPRSLWLRLRAWRAGDRGDGRPNRFVLFSDEELDALADATAARPSNEDLSLHRRRLSGQVHAERQRRAETS